MNIIFIYADDCIDCKRMETFLKQSIKESKKEIDIVYVNSETKKAIEIAVEYGIEDLPACVIGDSTFFGKDGFTYDDILDAINVYVN